MKPPLSLICVLLLSLSATAQSRVTEKDLESLRDKLLTLGNFSRSSQLHFDSAGVPKKIEDPAPWALYSQFQVETIKIEPNRLFLRGPRIVSHFDPKMQKMVQLRSNLLLEVAIDLKKDATTADVGIMLSRVFIRSQDLVTRVPHYWKEFLEGGPKQSLGPPPAANATATIPQVSGDIMKARLIKQIIPKYPEDARQYLFEGYVMFKAEISEKGDVENLMILSPAGAGFDENAAEAVSRWKYSPHLLNGTPTRVITMITVNYTFQR